MKKGAKKLADINEHSASRTLSALRATGKTVAENDGWKNSSDVTSAGDRVGAFKLGNGSRDAALLATLTGLAVIEPAAPRLVVLSLALAAGSLALPRVLRWSDDTANSGVRQVWTGLPRMADSIMPLVFTPTTTLA